MKTRQLLIIGGILLSLLIIVIVASLAISNQKLQVVMVSPTSDKVATISPYIDITFNEAIKSVGSADLNSETAPVEIKDSRVRVVLANLEAGANYTILLTSIESKSGKKLDEYTFAFSPHYTEFNRLPEDAQKELINRSSSNQVNDPFLSNKFPRRVDTKDGSYIIEVDPTIETNGVVIVRVSFLAELSYYPDQYPQVSNDVAERLYQDVIKTIKGLKGTPDKYEFIFSNIYLNNKYTYDNEETHGD